MTIEFTAPEVRARTAFAFRLSVLDEGKEVFAESREYSSWPRRALAFPQGVKIALYDPQGLLPQAIASSAEVLQELQPPRKGTQVLIVAPGAFREAEVAEPVIGAASGGRALNRFVRRGGRVLVLAQETIPAGLLPVTLSDRASTMTFPQVKDHPILAKLEPKDLKWWADDHLVTHHEPVRPNGGIYRPVVVSGARQGLAYAPILEVPSGKGTFVFCQMRLIEKMEQEPVAAQLLQNALNYVATFEGSRGKLAMVGLGAAERRVLADLGVQCEELSGSLASINQVAHPVVMTGGDCREVLATQGAAEQYAEDGGTLYVHKPSPRAATALLQWTGSDLQLQSYAGIVQRRVRDEVTRSLTLEDLYWLGKHTGKGFATTPLASNVADYVLVRDLPTQGGAEYPAEKMDVQGRFHSLREEGGVSLASGDCTARFEHDFGAGGEFVFGVSAGGTPCEDIFPALSLTVGGKQIGHLSTMQQDYRVYTCSGTVPAGKQEVVIRFTNDKQILGVADRNLYLEKVIIARAQPLPAKLRRLTEPAALTSVTMGRGRIVIDFVNWDTEERNATKAARYVSALLTELGVAGSPEGGTILEAESFEPDPEMPHFSKRAGAVFMGSNGWIERQVRCAEGGRYMLELVGGGTEVDGVYPIVAVEIDGRKCGEVELRSRGRRGFRLPVELTVGEHTVRLSFTNDEYRPPLDRNLVLDKVVFYPVDEQEPQPKAKPW